VKFTPRLLEDNVNVSKTHPLIELCWLLGGLILAVGIVFSVLGLLTDWVVSKTPLDVERWLGQQALQRIPANESPLLQKSLEGLLRSLPADSPLHRYSFQVLLAESSEVNAIALPGGNIMVFSGLIARIESENELAMILAHEMGHFVNRDHLRGLGRGLGMAVGTALLFG
jgi:predicted Zn-dependent protease